MRVAVDLSPAQFGFDAIAHLWLTVVPGAIDDTGKALSSSPETTFTDAVLGKANLFDALNCRDTEALYTFVTFQIGALPTIRQVEAVPVLHPAQARRHTGSQRAIGARMTSGASDRDLIDTAAAPTPIRRHVEKSLAPEISSRHDLRTASSPLPRAVQVRPSVYAAPRGFHRLVSGQLRAADLTAIMQGAARAVRGGRARPQRPVMPQIVQLSAQLEVPMDGLTTTWHRGLGVDPVSNAQERGPMVRTTAHCLGMTAWLASVIAVTGTLLGSTITFVFQRSHAERAERFARDERLRQERTAAYSAFAAAFTELRRGVITLWFIRLRTGDDRTDPELLAAYTESDRLGAAAAHARFRVQLLANDADLVALADAAFPPITAIRNAADHAELAGHEGRSENKLKAFIEAAGAQVR